MYCFEGRYSIQTAEGTNAGCASCEGGLQRNLAGTSCVPCPEGRFSNPGEQCSFCSPGKQPSEDKAACISCDEIGDTLYSRTGISCESCPPGRQPGPGWEARDNATEHPEIIFLGNGTACVDCPAGKQSPHGGPCTSCSGNTYSHGGADSPLCLECDAGSVAVVDHSRCTCKIGMYNISYGLVLCIEDGWEPDIFESEEYDGLRAAYRSGDTCARCPSCLDCSKHDEPPVPPDVLAHVLAGGERAKQHLVALLVENRRTSQTEALSDHALASYQLELCPQGIDLCNQART
eukprot:SAG11_NODE_1072_length_5974_cov_1.634553_7_plen_290_part_00